MEQYKAYSQLELKSELVDLMEEQEFLKDEISDIDIKKEYDDNQEKIDFINSMITDSVSSEPVEEVEEIEQIEKIEEKEEPLEDDVPFPPIPDYLFYADGGMTKKYFVPRYVKDKISPNFLNVYIDYPTPSGVQVAYGKETMSGQQRRLGSEKAMNIAKDIVKDIKEKHRHNLEDIDYFDNERGKVTIFAVSDDFEDTNFALGGYLTSAGIGAYYGAKNPKSVKKVTDPIDKAISQIGKNLTDKKFAKGGSVVSPSGIVYVVRGRDKKGFVIAEEIAYSTKDAEKKSIKMTLEDKGNKIVDIKTEIFKPKNYAKGGEVEFRKLANSKNFDILTPDGRYEIEMGAFGIPKSIIDGDTRKDINTNPIAIKYRGEIQEYIDDNSFFKYAKGGNLDDYDLSTYGGSKGYINHSIKQNEKIVKKMDKYLNSPMENSEEEYRSREMIRMDKAKLEAEILHLKDELKEYAKGGELDDILGKLDKVRNEFVDLKLKSDLNTEEGVAKFRKKAEPLKKQERKLEDKLEQMGEQEYSLPFAKGGLTYMPKDSGMVEYMTKKPILKDERFVVYFGEGSFSKPISSSIKIAKSKRGAETIRKRLAKSEEFNNKDYSLNMQSMDSFYKEYPNLFAKGGKVNKVYVDYMNKKKGFRPDRKYFKTYEEAEKWGRKEFERFNSDMIGYTEYERPLNAYAKGGKIKVGDYVSVDAGYGMKHTGKVNSKHHLHNDRVYVDGIGDALEIKRLTKVKPPSMADGGLIMYAEYKDDYGDYEREEYFDEGVPMDEVDNISIPEGYITQGVEEYDDGVYKIIFQEEPSYYEMDDEEKKEYLKKMKKGYVAKSGDIKLGRYFVPKYRFDSQVARTVYDISDGVGGKRVVHFIDHMQNDDVIGMKQEDFLDNTFGPGGGEYIHESERGEEFPGVNYEKGGETASPITNYHKNFMGTLSFDLKVKGMRKPQDFIVYPITGKTNIIKIQSDKKWGEIDATTGKGILSKTGNNSWAFALDVSNRNVNKFELSDEELEELKNKIRETSGKEVGNAIITTDNSGAELLADGGVLNMDEVSIYQGADDNYTIVMSGDVYDMNSFSMPNTSINTYIGDRRDYPSDISHWGEKIKYDNAPMVIKEKIDMRKEEFEHGGKIHNDKEDDIQMLKDMISEEKDDDIKKELKKELEKLKTN